MWAPDNRVPHAGLYLGVLRTKAQPCDGGLAERHERYGQVAVGMKVSGSSEPERAAGSRASRTTSSPSQRGLAKRQSKPSADATAYARWPTRLALLYLAHQGPCTFSVHWKRSEQIHPDSRLPGSSSCHRIWKQTGYKVNQSAEGVPLKVPLEVAHKLQIGPREHGSATQSATHFDLLLQRANGPRDHPSKVRAIGVWPNTLSVSASGPGYCFKSFMPWPAWQQSDLRSDPLPPNCSEEPSALSRRFYTALPPQRRTRSDLRNNVPVAKGATHIHLDDPGRCCERVPRHRAGFLRLQRLKGQGLSSRAVRVRG
jgi:hypothetical protein